MTGFSFRELQENSPSVINPNNGFSFEELSYEKKVDQAPQMPEVGTYTQDDMVENDAMFNIIEDYMLDRYGIQAVEDKDRRTIVDDFLDNRRGVSGGNTIRGLTEIDYINDIKENPERLAKASAAYELYENMAGLFSKETTFAEKAEGIMDFTRTAILDPANIVGGIFGKLVAGGGVRVALAGARKLALKEGQKVLRKTGDKKLAKEAVEKVLKKELKSAQQKGAKELADYKNQLMNTKGLKKLRTSQNIKEIGGAVAFDTAVNTGMEYIYQSGLIQTGVRDNMDKFSLGMVALGSTIIGGVQIGRVLLKGTSDTAMPSAVVAPESDDVLDALSKSMEEYGKITVEKTSTWKTKVAGGRELEDLDSEFFVDLLLGHQQDGEVLLKGFAQIASERGLTWSKRFEDDKYSDWIAEIIKDSKPEDIKKFITSFEKATGTKLNQAKELTVEEFANTFARKINNSARILNAASQGSKINGISVEDLTVGNLINDAVGLGLLPK
jgi:hypothetical protein